MHWLATATAMAAVVAAAGLLQPDAATASQAGPPQTTAHGRRAAPPPPTRPASPSRWTAAARRASSTKQASGDLDGDGRPETVAVVRCDAGSGTPPSGVYVLTSGRSGPAPAHRRDPAWTRAEA